VRDLRVPCFALNASHASLSCMCVRATFFACVCVCMARSLYISRTSLSYTLMVMAPEYAETRSARTAWATGLFAATLTGLLELASIPLVFAIRASIPRAALRASVAGVAFTAVTMGFAFEVVETCFEHAQLLWPLQLLSRVRVIKRCGSTVLVANAHPKAR